MKLLAALVAVTLATPVSFAQELEEAPGAAPMNTAPPPSSEELNNAVDQLSREKSQSPAPKSDGPLKHGKSFATKAAPKKVAKKEMKKAAKAAKKSAAKAKGKKAKKKKK